MPIYVTLLHYTERGVHHVKDTVKREEAFKTRAKKHGVTFKDAIWTLGAHDGVLVFEAPDDETATAVILSAKNWAMFAPRQCALHGCRDGKVTGKGRLATGQLAPVPDMAPASFPCAGITSPEGQRARDDHNTPTKAANYVTRGEEAPSPSAVAASPAASATGASRKGRSHDQGNDVARLRSSLSKSTPDRISAHLHLAAVPT